MGHRTLALIQTMTPTEELPGTRSVAYEVTAKPLDATAKIALGTASTIR
jgi:hypothetical protein